MVNCIIHPIPLYQEHGDKSTLLYRFDCGQQFTVVGYIWYIEGAREKILVDAGGSTEFISKVLGRKTCEEIQTVDYGLSKFGLSCNDIDLVILTHLHHDHIAQASRFPKARFLVQRDELEFAQNPHPFFAAVYPKKFFEGLNFEVISGDNKVSDAISVLSTPGHTMGGQSVLISTAQGTAIISGLCTTQENFEPLLVGKTSPVIPPTPHCDVLQAYDSMVKIKEMADILVPNHEAKYSHIDSIP